MSKKRKRVPQKRESEEKASVGYLLGTVFDDLCCMGYTSLDKCPEIMTACRVYAELIGSMTIYLMANTKNGDVRIRNELSRKIDINPMTNMTRSEWMEAIVMNLLLYGDGNSVVVPHTWDGIIRSLEPIAADRVSFVPVNNSYREYRVLIDGKPHDPETVMHFTYNPDNRYLWLGRGVQISLRDLAKNLKQAGETENGFMSSKWKPSIIVKVDSMIDKFSTPEGRKKILDDYVRSAEAGEPWLIPAEQFQVEQIRPLSLEDLAIKDTVEMDRKMVASVFGLPPFVLGVGEYNQKAWNNFIQTKIKPLAQKIAQKMTNTLIVNPDWYLKFNERSLYDWDVVTMSQMLGGLYDRGVITGNEIRDSIGYDPMDGLNELRLLENYLPIDRLGDQKKLIQGGNE